MSDNKETSSRAFGVVAEGRVSDALLTVLLVLALAGPITGGWLYAVFGVPEPPSRLLLVLLAGFGALRFLYPRWHAGYPRELLDELWTRRYPVAVGALFLVGLFLRVWGISYGLPVITHPDEPDPIGVALGMLQTGSFDPNWFYYGSLYIYLVLPFFGLHYIGLKGRGEMRTITDISQFEPGFYRVARLVSAVAGALTIVFAYLLAKRVWAGDTGKRAGVIAAAIVTFSYLHVAQSHHAVTDALLVMLITVALMAMMDVVNRGSWRDYFVAGLIIGLAGATKYSAVPLVAVLFLAHFLGRPLKEWFTWKPAVGFGGVAVGFLAGMPYAVLNWTMFLDHMGFLRTISSTFTDPVARFSFLFGYSFESGFGFLLALMVWGSLLVALHRRKPAELVLAASALLFLGLITNAEIRVMPRYWLTALPSVAVLVGGYVSLASEWVQRRFELPRGAVAAATVALVAVAVLPNARDSVRFDQLSAKPDSRAAAYEWLNENYPAGTVVASEAWIRGVPRGVEFERAEPAHGLSLEELRERGIRVVLFSSVWDQNLARDEEATEARRLAREGLRELRAFPGFGGDLQGPDLIAYEVPEAAGGQ